MKNPFRKRPAPTPEPATQPEIAAGPATVLEQLAQFAEANPEVAASMIAEEAATRFTSDEGVPFKVADADTVVNVSSDLFDSRRRELHVGGVPFIHVADDALGRWIYRHDS